MKTTLDIPEALLEEAMRLSGANTKRMAVLTALDDYTRRSKLKCLADRLGDSDTFMAPETLSALRALETPGTQLRKGGFSRPTAAEAAAPDDSLGPRRDSLTQ